MEWTSSEVVGVITYLLPGFVTAWVFYGLTAHPRREPFERVVQALIFTAIVQTVTTGLKIALESAPKEYVLGTWTKEVALVWSNVIAVILGVLVSLFANKNWCHKFLHLCRITKRTSFPSEWYSVFNHEPRHLILHLEGGRRLSGWPEEWPDHPDAGHFVICDPAWVLADKEVPLYNVEQFVVPAKSVEMIEVMKRQSEITASRELIADAAQTLVSLSQEEEENGEQVSATRTEAVGGTEHNGEAAANIAAATPSLPAAAAKNQVNTRKKKR
jgi:hypothetical protein